MPPVTRDAWSDGDGGEGTASTWRDPRPTIEQRYEVEATLAGLGLEDGQGVPLGRDDRFVLRELIGRGSMGAVFLAEDLELERSVAIKVVARRVEHDRLELRLRREARALAALDHPNVLKVYDLGNDGGELFIAMEHVAGKDLRTWQRNRRLAELLDAYLQAGRGLAAAHARGIVHRDFKPDNVLVDEHAEGGVRVRVGDFGLAGDELGGSAEGATERPSKDLVTSSRTLLGTLPYMAPEQLRRERADARSDQHQFCVALWEAIAGQRPFGSRGRALEGDTSVPARPPPMPRWLYRVLARGLAFEQDERYPTMDALLAALTRGLRWQQLRPWAILVAIVATVAAIAWWARPAPCQDTAAPVTALWTTATRSEIAARLSSSAGGADMTGYVVSTIDRAVASWSEQAQSVCEAQQSGSALEQRELERQQQCLDQWADQMQQRIDRLRKTSDASLTYAFALVADLRSMESSCEIPPIPIDPSVDEAIEHATNAELLRELGEASELATEAVALARDRGRPCQNTGMDGSTRSSELAAALFRLGHIQDELRETDASLATLTQAHLNAYACGDWHRDARARLHTARILANLGDVDGAKVALEEAQVALQLIGEPSVGLRRYDERMAAGIVAEHAGDYEAARRHAEEGLVALGDDEDPILRAKLLNNIGVAYHKEGRLAEAIAINDEAASLVADALGADHPQALVYAARSSLNHGLAALEVGDFPRMREHLSVAASSIEPWVAVRALTAWAQGEYAAEDYDAAKTRTTALLAILGEHPTLPPIELATAETTAGQIYAALEDPNGIEVLERACPRWTELEQDTPAAQCELTLAQALHAAGRGEQARRWVERLRRRNTSGPLGDAIDELVRELSRTPQPEPAP